MSKLKKYNSYSEINGKYEIFYDQRKIMWEKVGEIQKHIYDRLEQKKEPIFGTVDFVEYDNRLILTDGQHRILAIKKVYEEKHIDIPFNAVIYNTDDENELRFIFVTKNKNTPMPDYYLKKSDDKNNLELLKQIETKISKTKGFRYNINNRPDVNIKTFLDILYTSKILHILKSLADYEIMYEFINNSFKMKIMDYKYIKANRLNGNKILEKCRESDNYLGIDLVDQKLFTWMNDKAIITTLNSTKLHNLDLSTLFNDEPEGKESQRIKFTLIQRQEVWHKYIGEDKGKVKCPYCKINDISPFLFTIAHVISLHNKGTNDISNLRPVCTNCNSSDGVNNLDLTKYSVI